jgi:hypothetical protein
MVATQMRAPFGIKSPYKSMTKRASGVKRREDTSLSPFNGASYIYKYRQIQVYITLQNSNKHTKEGYLRMEVSAYAHCGAVCCI